MEKFKEIMSESCACFGINDTYLLSIDKKKNLNFYKDAFETIEKRINLLEVIELLSEKYEIDLE